MVEPERAVEFAMMITCLLTGLSHLLRPDIWTRFFSMLADMGTSGPVAHGFLSLPAGILIITLHQVWRGPGLVLTIWGLLLMAKAVSGFLLPELAVRSLALARNNDFGFRIAGIAMLGVAASCAWALYG